MALSGAIKELRVQKGLTQQLLADKLGVSVVTIRCWEAGTKNPSMSALICISDTFDISIDSMLGVEHRKKLATDSYSSRERRLISEYRMLDVYGKDVVDAVCEVEKARVNKQSMVRKSSHPEIYVPHYVTPSAAGQAFPNDNDVLEMVRVPRDCAASHADFAVSISGDSMYPLINDGDIVFVQQTSELRNGEVGIFEVDGATYCKHFYMDQHRNITLVSANQERRDSNIYLAADCNSEFRCFGRVLLDRKAELPDYFCSCS